MQCLKLTSLDLEQHLLFKYYILKQENIFGMYYFLAKIIILQLFNCG